jgi:hypothetical protein
MYRYAYDSIRLDTYPMVFCQIADVWSAPLVDIRLLWGMRGMVTRGYNVWIVQAGALSSSLCLGEYEGKPTLARAASDRFRCNFEIMRIPVLLSSTDGRWAMAFWSCRQSFKRKVSYFVRIDPSNARLSGAQPPTWPAWRSPRVTYLTLCLVRTTKTLSLSREVGGTGRL